MDAIPIHKADMQHGGCVVRRVDARDGVENGFAQISFGVGKPYAFVDRGGEIALYEYILPDIGEYHSHTGVLTDRAEFLPRQLLVFEQLVEHVSRRAIDCFARAGAFKGDDHIIGQVAAGAQAKPANGFDELCGLNDTHAAAPPFRAVVIGTHRKTNYRTNAGLFQHQIFN